ncbi:MAG: hypothetical protein WDW36_009435 [Sanguina aurantia]
MSHSGQLISLAKGAILNNGRYKIDRELNRGGTAVVYGAEDLSRGGAMVALKVMNGPDQVPIKVVKREINFSSSVQHENIVRLLDVFAEKQQLVIVWELIAGPDLLDLLNECGGHLPEDMAAFFFMQLLKAVMFMHENGFCHRDIKPENAMVIRSTFQLKLIDFGLSKHLQSAQTLGVGTPDYMCPEMLQQQNGMRGTMPMGGMGYTPAAAGAGSPATPHVPYDAKAVDAWAMGVLMYLLITGKYPFEDPAHPNNLAHTIHNVLAGRVRPFPPGTSSGCMALVGSLLQTQPSQRQTLKGLMADAWLKQQAVQYAKKVGHMEVLDNLGQYHAMQLDDSATHALSMPNVEEDPMTEAQAAGSPKPATATEVAGPSKLNKSAFSKFSSYFKKKKLTGSGCM